MWSITWKPTTYGVYLYKKSTQGDGNGLYLEPQVLDGYRLDSIIETSDTRTIRFTGIVLDFENHTVHATLENEATDIIEEYNGEDYQSGDGTVRFSFENANAGDPQLEPLYVLRYYITYASGESKNNHSVWLHTTTDTQSPEIKYLVEFPTEAQSAYCDIQVTSGHTGDSHNWFPVEPGDDLSFSIAPLEHGYINSVKDNSSTLGKDGGSYTISSVSEYHKITIKGGFRYTVTVNNAEAIYPNSVTVNRGNSRTFTYSHLGYHIVEWMLDGVRTGVSEQTYTISNIQADHTIDVIEEADTYILTSGDQTFIHPSIVEVEYGGSATFTAAWLGYRVADWLLDGEGTGVSGDQYTVENVTGDHTVNARWVADIYPVTVNAVGEGTTWVEGVYQYGIQRPTLHATPAENWNFKGWYYNDTLLSTDRDYTPTGSYPREPLVFDAMFSKTSTIKVTLTAYPDDSCGSVVGGGEYYKGDEVTITAIANKGYRFVRWCMWIALSDEWKEVSTSPTYTFTVSSKRNSIYRAEFEEASDKLPADRQAVMDALLCFSIPAGELAMMVTDTEKPIDRGLLRKYLASLSSYARKLSEVEENVLNI